VPDDLQLLGGREASELDAVAGDSALDCDLIGIPGCSE
jgi:hypothetical protein